jgi:hypothetical protein
MVTDEDLSHIAKELKNENYLRKCLPPLRTDSDYDEHKEKTIKTKKIYRACGISSLDL